ncbi:hypothetical protein E2C01_052767 [Portunus trituberculatus]|uniref:Uncharacterized protein n=1 Tax=Portunus trituberculatus TaxID=210409 RepID=A0A5B7GP42_PORTR|nr:hypothetical protein [Portunus trituberculatus]
MEVTPESYGFSGEAGPRWPVTLSVPAVVPEETLEGSIGPTLVAGGCVCNQAWAAHFTCWVDILEMSTGEVKAFHNTVVSWENAC